MEVLIKNVAQFVTQNEYCSQFVTSGFWKEKVEY